jgi:hypothetical protein
MRIEYEDQELEVEILQHDTWDDDQPYLLKFPQTHPMGQPEGVWMDARDYVVLEAGNGGSESVGSQDVSQLD